MRSRRAILYTPGNDMHKIIKAAQQTVDSVCMDLEDSITVNDKENARKTSAEALATLTFESRERLVRINPVQSPYASDDLAVILPAHPDGIIVPKVESAGSLQWVSRQISMYEDENGWKAGSIVLIAQIESARAIVNLAQFCAADERLRALVFGSEDLAASLGVQRTPEGTELLHARSAVVLHAAAFGLQAIDQICPDFQDMERLEVDSRQGLLLGYQGKQVIHPAQIDLVQQIFNPTEKQVNDAQLILNAYVEHVAHGDGVFAMQGKMVDLAIVRNAERVIERAKAGGVIN
ncbi:MAG: CoA ester lyase [Anaerolineaceae bacterium]|nr:CoA ester lyase [Anaerolineaceae bacterium]